MVGSSRLSTVATFPAVVHSQCLKVLFTSSLESTTDRYSAKKGYFDARIRIYYQVRAKADADDNNESLAR